MQGFGLEGLGIEARLAIYLSAGEHGVINSR
jgi:hypothetical protein